MRFNTHSIKWKLATLVIPGLAAVLLVIGMGYWGFERVQNHWKEYRSVIHSKERYVGNMRTHLGYGHAIHQFKNYILRGQRQHFNDYLESVEKLSRDVAAYRNVGQLTKAEEGALNQIMAFTEAYKTALFKARDLWKQGVAVSEIDKAVKSDDIPYLAALNALSGEIEKASDIYMEELNRIIVQALVLFLVTGVILVVVLPALSVSMSRSIAQPILRLRESMTEAQRNGGMMRRAHLNGYEEINMLSEAFNHMAEAIADKNTQLSSLNQAAIELTSTLGLNELLDQIMQRGVLLTASKASCIAFYDQESGRFKEWVTHGLSDHFVKNMAFRRGGLADEAFTTTNTTTKGTYILSNDRPETKHKLSKLAWDEGIRSFICLPLSSQTNRLGVIYFYCTDRDTFTSDEIELLTTFASLAAEAIEKARLFVRTADQAATDALTGLPNRRILDQRLTEELRRAQRYNKSLSLMLLDVDHFKKVNDGYGHLAGDAVLKALTKLLSKQIRDVDFVARYGGEEFMFILPETDSTGAKLVAQRIRQAVAGTPFPLPDGRNVGVTVSIGIVCFPHCGEGVQELTERADQAMYTAKLAGRNQVVLYQEMLKAELEKNPQRIAELLNESLDNISPIATAVDVKVTFMRQHSQDTEKLVSQFGKTLKLNEADTNVLKLAAQLHDIGTISVPGAILNKPEALTGEEWRIMKQHSVTASEILAKVPALSHVVPAVRHHHERYDGTGYPDGLKGEAIPYLARLLCIVDAYCAIVADRPQRRALTPEQARTIIANEAGKQFDPVIAKAFLKMLEKNSDQG